MVAVRRHSISTRHIISVHILNHNTKLLVKRLTWAFEDKFILFTWRVYQKLNYVKLGSVGKLYKITRLSSKKSYLVKANPSNHWNWFNNSEILLRNLKKAAARVTGREQLSNSSELLGWLMHVSNLKLMSQPCNRIIAFVIRIRIKHVGYKHLDINTAVDNIILPTTIYKVNRHYKYIYM